MTLLSTSSYYIIQLSGQKAQEYLLLKTQLKEHGFRMIRPKTKLLSTLVPLELSKMCMGPISLIYKNKQEDPNPKLVFKACEKSGGKMLLLGASVQDLCLSRDGVMEIMDLPSVDVMRGELVGVLEHRARELVHVLGIQQEEMVSLLERREYE
jgi:ribosomal protein L10